MKTTGVLWKEFYNDEAFWEGYYHDDTLILFDDVEVEEYEDPSPDAVVKIESGYVYKTDDSFTSHDLSLETFFKRWKKKQTTRTMVVTVDKDDFAKVFETISNIPGVKKVK